MDKEGVYMIEIVTKEYKDILVIQLEQVDDRSTVIQKISKPQLLHIYDYDVHFFSGRTNIDTLLYYITRFEIDFLALNIPLMKHIKLGKHVINRLKQNRHDTKVIVNGDAVTREIAKDIGADGYTHNGEDIVKVIESILKADLLF